MQEIKRKIQKIQNLKKNTRNTDFKEKYKNTEFKS